jgi:hypothetical protein
MTRQKEPSILLAGAIVVLLLSLCACGQTKVDESSVNEPPGPESIEEGAPEETFPDGAYEIRDNRARKTSLLGKYEYQSGIARYLPEEEREYFEIFDGYAILKSSWEDQRDGKRIIEIDEYEGITWLCFGREDLSVSLHLFYSADLKDFVFEDADARPSSGNIYRKTGQEPNPVAPIHDILPDDVFEIDSSKLIWFGKTYSEINRDNPNMELRLYLSDISRTEADPPALEFYYAKREGLYFGFHCWEMGFDDASLTAIGAPVTEIFPNIKDRLFTYELGTFIGERPQTEKDEYQGQRVKFRYQGYDFWYYTKNSFDLFPEMTLFVKPIE